MFRRLRRLGTQASELLEKTLATDAMGRRGRCGSTFTAIKGCPGALLIFKKFHDNVTFSRSKFSLKSTTKNNRGSKPAGCDLRKKELRYSKLEGCQNTGCEQDKCFLCSSNFYFFPDEPFDFHQSFLQAYYENSRICLPN